jgi:hypothetical protein
VSPVELQQGNIHLICGIRRSCVCNCCYIVLAMHWSTAAADTATLLLQRQCTNTSAVLYHV